MPSSSTRHGKVLSGGCNNMPFSRKQEAPLINYAASNRPKPTGLATDQRHHTTLYHAPLNGSCKAPFSLSLKREKALKGKRAPMQPSTAAMNGRLVSPLFRGISLDIGPASPHSFLLHERIMWKGERRRLLFPCLACLGLLSLF